MAIRLAVPFGSGMVLQRDVPCAVWGQAEPGRVVRFELQGQRAEALTDDQGHWRVVWDSLFAGGPWPLTESGVVVAEQVWVGDVWLCAGQSNLERSLAQSDPWPDDSLALKGDPGLRQVRLPARFSFVPQSDDLEPAPWLGADTDGIVEFSAVGFALARELRAQTGVPQGLVVIAVGGSTAQAWLSGPALEAFPDLAAEAARFADPAWLAQRLTQEAAQQAKWKAELEALDPPRVERTDLGPWSPDATVPDCGSAWFRTTFVLPEVPKSDGRLSLGTLVDADTVWINGQWVGETGYQYPSRRYLVPPSCLQKGANSLVVRLVAPQGGLGFTPGKVRRLTWPGLSFDLGRWERCAGASMSPLPPATFLPLISRGLFEGLLAPLRGLTFRAVLWYQGESNTGDGGRYEALLRTLVDLWRQHFGRPTLPFAVVQLPLFGVAAGLQRPSGWAEVREAQRLVCRDLGLGLVVALDLGEGNDIHPTGKAELGRRAALVLRKIALHDNLPVWTGPLLKSTHLTPGELRLVFEPVGEGLCTRDGRPARGFWLQEGAWYECPVRFEFDTVVIALSSGQLPTSLCYGWADHPADATVVNSEGLPMSPFQLSLTELFEETL